MITSKEVKTVVLLTLLNIWVVSKLSIHFSLPNTCLLNMEFHRSLYGGTPDGPNYDISMFSDSIEPPITTIRTKKIPLLIYKKIHSSNMLYLQMLFGFRYSSKLLLMNEDLSHLMHNRVSSPKLYNDYLIFYII